MIYDQFELNQDTFKTENHWMKYFSISNPLFQLHQRHLSSFKWWEQKQIGLSNFLIKHVLKLDHDIELMEESSKKSLHCTTPTINFVILTTW